MDNRISATLSAAHKAAALQKLTELKALLPFLINLTPEEKKSMPRMGTNRQAMDDAFSQSMGAHSELVPDFVDEAELAADRALNSALYELFQCAHEICEGIEDTMMAASADNYLAYLSYYNNVKQAAKRNVQGANTIYDNLKRFFPRGRRNGDTPVPVPTP